MIPGSRISSMLLQLFQHCSHKGLGLQAHFQDLWEKHPSCAVWGGPGVAPRSTGVTRFPVLAQGGRAAPLHWCQQMIRKQLLTPSYSYCPLPGPSLIEPWELTTVLQEAVWWERMDTGENNIEQTWSQLHLQIRSSFAYVSWKTVLVWQSYIDLLL